MLLITLIENAFKYGISIQEPSFIDINLSIDAGMLNLTVRNSMHHHKITDTENSQSGIGLSNVRDRLELVYPGRYRFTAGQENDQYTVQLNIKL